MDEVKVEELKNKQKFIEENGTVYVGHKYHQKKYKFDRYGLTAQGKPVSVDSLCTLLANVSESTYVLLTQDKDDLGLVKDENVDWDEPFNEPKLQELADKNDGDLHEPLGRFCSYHTTDITGFNKNI